MKIERIQSPTTGGSIPVLRRAEGQESDNGKYVGATHSDPHQKRGGRYYPPQDQQRKEERRKEGAHAHGTGDGASTELHSNAALGEKAHLTVSGGDERIPLLDITA